MNHISDTIRGLFPDALAIGLPRRVRCMRRDIAGETYTWSSAEGMYLADAGGPGFMTWYVARALGVLFFEVEDQPQQLFMILRVA